MTLPSHVEVILSCFKRFSDRGSRGRTWFESRDYCRTIGGDLASFHSDADLKVLKGYSKTWVIRKKNPNWFQQETKIGSCPALRQCLYR